MAAIDQRRRGGVTGFVFAVACLLATFTSLSSAQVGGVTPEPVVTKALYVSVSPPVRHLGAVARPESGKTAGARRAIRANPTLPRALDRTAVPAFGVTDLVQTRPPAAPGLPVPRLVFDGLSVASQGLGVYPPDTVGDVGPGHYVQMVNVRWQVFDKATGAPLTPVLSLSALWAAAGRDDACARSDDGDPIVVYDSFADRWILSQFAFASLGTPPYYECLAVSTTPDPTGSYYLYSFVVPEESPGVAQFPDYPKLGVWPDAYYMTVNQFRNGGPFDGSGVYALERAAMLRGDAAARLVYFNLNLRVAPEQIGGLLPADADGLRPPVAGTPHVLAYFTATEFFDPEDGLRLFDVHVDWNDPAASRVTPRPEATLAAPLPVAPFDPRAPWTRSDIEQPGTDIGLDSISDRLMHRLQYRNHGTHESLVVNHTVNVGSCGSAVDAACHRAGVRWYELQRSGGPYHVAQQGTFAPATRPDGGGDPQINRWMGSAATDGSGNLVIGYSAASSTTFPSVWYAGRRAGDPDDQLTLGEGELVAGSGSQTGPAYRWGDYSALTVDPVSDCEFWYTQEYYAATALVNWRTIIGAFGLGPGRCTPPESGRARVSVTACDSGAPLPGAGIRFDDVAHGVTAADGAFGARLPPGLVSVTAERPGYDTAVGAVAIAPRETTGLALCLRPVPLITDIDARLVVDGCAPPDGQVEPGERVTFDVTVRNIGAGATTDLVAAVLPGPHVLAPGAPRRFGIVPPGGQATQAFSWTAAGSCNERWSARLALADAGTALGEVSLSGSFGVTRTTTAAVESFDGVAAPSLPAGWSVLDELPTFTTWGTATSAADTAPNAVAVDDPPVVTLRALVSPPFAVPAGGASVLEFRNAFATEAGFDGGVLEISVAGDDFRDIIEAGGVFLEGGYNAVLSAFYGNPLPRRPAWSGRSDGFTTTRVMLPALSAGRDVVLRFRLGTDDSVGAAGWWIDGVRLLREQRWCAPCAAVTPVLAPLTAPLVVGGGNTIGGTGFTPGSVLRLFVSTASGALALGPLTPVGVTPTTLSVLVPASVPLANGFASLQVINTDHGYTESNVIGTLLDGDAAANLPTITAIDGGTRRPADLSVGLALVERVVSPGGIVEIAGTGFGAPRVNIYTLRGNLGPLTPLPGATPTSLQVVVPASAPTGPGVFEVVNAPYGAQTRSNAVAATVGARPSITSVTTSGTTIVVTGRGFSSGAVVNLFVRNGDAVVNLGGLTAAGEGRIPIATLGATRLEFARPGAAPAGPAYIEVLNPPFVPFASSAGDPDGAIVLP
jgi:hypothetical protein